MGKQGILPCGVLIVHFLSIFPTFVSITALNTPTFCGKIVNNITSDEINNFGINTSPNNNTGALALL